MTPASPTPTDPPDVSWEVIVRFVRQLTHDLRNHLNAVELQTAYLGEIAADAEMKEEVKRLREMLSTAGAALQTLSAGMGHARVNSMSYKASDFMEDVRKRFESRLPEKTSTIEWRIDVGETALDLDPQLLPLVVEELIENALRFGDGSDLKIDAGVENGNLILTLSEPKATFDHDLSKWGREPLKNMSHGHYGLGLNRARIIVESHGGKLEAKYDQTARNLVTRITLPALPPTG